MRLNLQIWLKHLYGILSDETLISILPFIENSKEEIEKRDLEKENTLDTLISARCCTNE